MGRFMNLRLGMQKVSFLAVLDDPSGLFDLLAKLVSFGPIFSLLGGPTLVGQGFDGIRGLRGIFLVGEFSTLFIGRKKAFGLILKA